MKTYGYSKRLPLLLLLLLLQLLLLLLLWFVFICVHFFFVHQHHHHHHCYDGRGSVVRRFKHTYICSGCVCLFAFWYVYIYNYTTSCFILLSCYFSMKNVYNFYTHTHNSSIGAICGVFCFTHIVSIASSGYKMRKLIHWYYDVQATKMERKKTTATPATTTTKQNKKNSQPDHRPFSFTVLIPYICFLFVFVLFHIHTY